MRYRYLLAFVLLVLLPIILSSCMWPFGSSTTSPSTTTTPATTPTTSTPPAVPAPVIQAWVSPTGITPKGSATLNWNVTNATSVVIDQGIGSVPPSGLRQVFPDVTTTYTITAYFAGGTVVNSVTLAVAPAGTPAPGSAGDKDWLGSTYTKEYHFPSCTIARNMTPPHKIWFETWQQAKAAGYRPCSVCRPPF